MESQGRCARCVHWDRRPELDMPVGFGYCEFHEKMKKADHSCDYFLGRNSPEGRAFTSQRYGGGEGDEEDVDDDEF